MHVRHLDFSGKYVDVDKLKLLLHLAVNLDDIGVKNLFYSTFPSIVLTMPPMRFLVLRNTKTLLK